MRRNAIWMICTIIGLLGSREAKAQYAPPECRIIYDYDVSGNRIKRWYHCTEGGIIMEPHNPSIFTNLFPNPTTGIFTGVFSEPTGSATFLISAVDGRIVQNFELTQAANSVQFDITAQVPGSYFLTVWAFNKVETWTVIKL